MRFIAGPPSSSVIAWRRSTQSLGGCRFGWGRARGRAIAVPEHRPKRILYWVLFSLPMSPALPRALEGDFDTSPSRGQPATVTMGAQNCMKANELRSGTALGGVSKSDGALTRHGGAFRRQGRTVCVRASRDRPTCSAAVDIQNAQILLTARGVYSGARRARRGDLELVVDAPASRSETTVGSNAGLGCSNCAKMACGTTRPM